MTKISNTALNSTGALDTLKAIASFRQSDYTKTAVYATKATLKATTWAVAVYLGLQILPEGIPPVKNQLAFHNASNLFTSQTNTVNFTPPTITLPRIFPPTYSKEIFPQATKSDTFTKFNNQTCTENWLQKSNNLIREADHRQLSTTSPLKNFYIPICSMISSVQDTHAQLQKEPYNKEYKGRSQGAEPKTLDTKQDIPVDSHTQFNNQTCEKHFEKEFNVKNIPYYFGSESLVREALTNYFKNKNSTNLVENHTLKNPKYNDLNDLIQGLVNRSIGFLNKVEEEC